jgi:peroxiredoxin Q/BCP
LKEGDRVPDVGALNQDGVSVRLSQFRGRMVVLYFYPKDQTSGCTQEAHGFTSEYDRIRQLGAEVVGVSNDNAQSHKKFCDNEALPFPLLADTDKSIATAFGVGSFMGLYKRITFLIDADGVIRKVFDPVKPLRHAAEVIAAIAEVSHQSPKE